MYHDWMINICTLHDCTIHMHSASPNCLSDLGGVDILCHVFPIFLGWTSLSITYVSMSQYWTAVLIKLEDHYPRLSRWSLQPLKTYQPIWQSIHELGYKYNPHLATESEVLNIKLMSWSESSSMPEQDSSTCHCSISTTVLNTEFRIEGLRTLRVGQWATNCCMFMSSQHP